MSDPDKSLTTELKPFELYGLRRVINAANTYKIASSDFVPLAEALLPEIQARAFAARWPTLTADEQTQICTMLEKDHG